jgi:hypothetical protein
MFFGLTVTGLLARVSRRLGRHDHRPSRQDRTEWSRAKGGLIVRTSTQAERSLGRVLSAVLAGALLAAPAAHGRPDLDDPRNPLVPPPAAPAQEVEVVTADSFDWADAGIGAGIATGMALLAGAAAATLTRRRGEPTAN